MDHKKSGQPSSEGLLSVQFVSSEFGPICKEMGLKCQLCGSLETVTVPDELINTADSEDCTGTGYAEIIARTKGWVVQPVKRTSGPVAMFMVCPECVETAFSTGFAAL